jgi:hypothetical protein
LFLSETFETEFWEAEQLNAALRDLCRNDIMQGRNTPTDLKLVDKHFVTNSIVPFALRLDDSYLSQPQFVNGQSSEMTESFYHV